MIVSWVLGNASLVLGLCGVAFLAVAVRGAYAGVFIQESGVRIVNLLNAVSVPWSDIERFELKGAGIRSRNAAAKLHDGRLLTIFAIAGPNPITRPNNRSAERLVDDLNAELDRRTAIRIPGG